jgi:lipopolysaccharide transport system ATP-binding protein
MLLPDGGLIVKRGRMEKMIELSAGFSPSLSGRENVTLKARLLGLSTDELARKLDDLVTFAELEEFIDTPVQFYSSGMRARLGFALSVVMQPHILLIDEVLAVGDLGFRMKCYARVDQMREKAAVVLVTHGMNHVARMATSSLVLHKGRVVHHGSVQDGIAKYQEISGFSKPAKDPAFNADLISFSLLSNENEVAQESTIDYGAELKLVGEHLVSEALTFSVIVQESGGNAVVDWNSRRANFAANSGEVFEVCFGQAILSPGFYQLCVVGFASDGSQRFLSRPLRFQVRGVFLGATRCQPVGVWRKRSTSSASAMRVRDSLTGTVV